MDAATARRLENSGGEMSGVRGVREVSVVLLRQGLNGESGGFERQWRVLMVVVVETGIKEVNGRKTEGLTKTC